MSNAKSKDFMKLSWEEQQKYLSTSSSKSVRYHPMIIRYCLGLATKSPAIYDEIRFDQKTNSGFVILPSRRRLRDYKNYIRPQRNLDPSDFFRDSLKALPDEKALVCLTT